MGARAMTAAERQARRRKRLRKERDAEWKRKERLRRREKNARDYIPTPPGVTYWRQVRVVTPEGEERDVWAPRTRPLAACRNDLEDDDVRALLFALHTLARQRGINLAEGDPATWTIRPLDEDESATVGAKLAALAGELEG
jgi:hypothetical protein